MPNAQRRIDPAAITRCHANTLPAPLNSPFGESMKTLLRLLVILCLAASARADSSFAFRETSDSALELSDGGKPVFVYNFGMILGKGFAESMRRSSYLHPVYSPDGVVLTDDFNPNHPHHRGIFWAWTDIAVDGKKGDIWTVKGPFLDRFVAWKARDTQGGLARMAVENGWFDGDPAARALPRCFRAG